MCGIAGIYGFEGVETPLLGVIDVMTDTMTHRGPDERGVKRFPRAALGNRRLKIIDLHAGQQPLANEDRTIWVTFNGEIYNYRALREQLLAQGHVFESASDTEVIVHAYESWGLDAFSRFNGQFAVAIYDAPRHRLVLARDRLGIKPLYYARRRQHLLFGSEVKALLAHPLVEAALNPFALTSYLGYRYPLSAHSWYEGVSMLEPGHLLVTEGREVAVRSYWSLPAMTEDRPTWSEEEMTAEVRALLTEAVRYRMISDVPIGAYLSGGLDSSIIVALMAQQSSEPIKTFTIGFEEEGFNEFSYARQVADRFATDHHEIVIQPTDYLALLPALIAYKDAPLSVPNEVPLYVMSQELKRYITVVLSGEGADELFGGYGRIFRSPYDFERMQQLRNGHLLLTPPEKEILIENLERLYGQLTFEGRQEHFLDRYAYTPLDAQVALLTPEFLERIHHDVGLRRFWETQFRDTAALSAYDQYRLLFQQYHLQGLLLRVDMTTMATAVEARVPFVDHQLVEYVIRHIPFEYLIRWRSPAHRQQAATLNCVDISEAYDIPKYLLRRAFSEDLPEDILARKKVGFPVPLDRWMRGDFGAFARDILLDEQTRRRGIFRRDTLQRWLSGDGPRHRLGQIIWMLVNVELWHRRYIDQDVSRQHVSESPVA